MTFPTKQNRKKTGNLLETITEFRRLNFQQLATKVTRRLLWRGEKKSLIYNAWLALCLLVMDSINNKLVLFPHACTLIIRDVVTGTLCTWQLDSWSSIDEIGYWLIDRGSIETEFVSGGLTWRTEPIYRVSYLYYRVYRWSIV